MSSTPPTPGSGVLKLMAEIERIAQELRAYNKRPLPATEEQVQALVKLAERERPLTLTVNSEAVAKQLIGKVDQQAQVFWNTGNKMIAHLDNWQRLTTSALDERVAALKAAEVSLQDTTQRIPKQVAVNWLSNWKVTALVAGMPVFLVLMMLWFTGMFSRVPKSELAQVKADLIYERNTVKWFRAHRDSLVKEHPKLAYQYFRYVGDPVPVKSKKVWKKGK